MVSKRTTARKGFAAASNVSWAFRLVDNILSPPQFFFFFSADDMLLSCRRFQFFFFFFCSRHCAEYNSLRFLTANHPYRVHKFLIIRLVRWCTKHIDWENKHTEAHFLPCVSVRPRFTNWKFGRDKFCREFWKGETNFVSPVRPNPKPIW